MVKSDLNAFLSVHNGTPIKLKTDLVDYIFASKVMGMYRQWLIVDYDEAMDAFGESMKPGSIFWVQSMSQKTLRTSTFSNGES